MTEEKIRARIKEELAATRSPSPVDIAVKALSGDDAAARAGLTYFTPPDRFLATLDAVLGAVAAAPKAPTGAAVVRSALRFFVHLYIDLGSFVPEWVLLKALSPDDVGAAATMVRSRLAALETDQPEAAAVVLEEIRAETVARIKAEGLADGAEAVAADLVSGGLVAYAEKTIDEIGSGNLREAAKARLEGRLATEIGNDYAGFLQHVVWLGGSFVTTNPVLIKLAWDVNPGYWDPKVDEAIRSLYPVAALAAVLAGDEEGVNSAIERINSLVTVGVVERNCRLLRPLFLLSEGRLGYVSMQVSPRNHNDGERMLAEALTMYGELEKRLRGVPNVVIKVPSTAAGLYAAERLTGQGIGVTITLTFSLFQGLEFAKTLARGSALVSYIAIMNGRLAFPVRDELKLAGVEGGVEAARWAGIEVARKAHHRIYGSAKDGGLGISPDKVRIMIASLRVYGDWIPDISELWGIPLITIFPNVRRAYDAVPRPLEPHTVENPTPSDALQTMLESELFRQAWWTPEDGEKGRPDRALSLSDADAVAAFTPVAETLHQFIGMYDEMSAMVKARMKAVAKA